MFILSEHRERIMWCDKDRMWKVTQRGKYKMEEAVFGVDEI